MSPHLFRTVKRGADIAISLMALLLLWPALFAIAIGIVLDDPSAGPLYRSTRCGKDSRPFTMYKFRSMAKDADARLAGLAPYNEMNGPAFKMRRDPRVTRFGGFLRKFCLDELPQLYNILRGEMSFVGPRPPIPTEVAQYTPAQRARLMVKPGLTCYWQIAPRRNALAFDHWLALDLQYIREQSLRLDLRLLFRTLRVVASGEGI